MLDAPDFMKWDKERHAIINILCVLLYIAYIVLIVGCVVFFGFIGAIFSLARKS